MGGEVSDVDGNQVPTQILDSFQVDLDPPPGDFNADGTLDCDDVDALSMAVASGSNDPQFDLTGEGVVNAGDLIVWIQDLKGTIFGDANLDFAVDGSDFLIWNSHKFSEGTAWCSGDFNSDGTTDGSDFVLWNDNKFQSADLAAVLRPLNPESSSSELVVIKAEETEHVERSLTPAAPPAALRVAVDRADISSTRDVPVDYVIADPDDSDDDDRWESGVDELFSRPANM